MKSKRRLIMALLMAAMMLLAMPMNAFAASNPYKDVTKSSVGSNAYTAITYVKAHKGYVDVISGKKFKPKQNMKRWEFLTMLSNFYGDEMVPVTMSDVRNANKAVTEKWAKDKMIGVAKNIGVEITWSGGNKKLSRALASQYLYNFAHYDSAFTPRK